MKQMIIILFVLIIPASILLSATTSLDSTISRINNYIGFDIKLNHDDLMKVFKKMRIKVNGPLKNSGMIEKIWDIEKNSFETDKSDHLLKHEEELLKHERERNSLDDLEDNQYSQGVSKSMLNCLGNLKDSYVYEITPKGGSTFAKLKIQKIYLVFFDEKLVTILYDYNTPIPQNKIINEFIDELKSPLLTDITRSNKTTNKYFFWGNSYFNYIIFSHSPSESACYILINCNK